jgi:hypothetical protein
MGLLKHILGLIPNNKTLEFRTEFENNKIFKEQIFEKDKEKYIIRYPISNGHYIRISSYFILKKKK